MNCLNATEKKPNLRLDCEGNHLGGDRVGSGGKEFGNAGGLVAFGSETESGPKSSSTSSNDAGIVLVVDDFIF